MEADAISGHKTSKNKPAFAKSGMERVTYLTQDQFDDIFQYQPASTTRLTCKKATKKLCKNFLSIQSFLNFLISFFPILKWFPEYNWKENVMGDLMAGITVGIVHVPQGIAYAILANVPPVQGLYTAFFGVLFYSFFGTSKHVSVGSFAVISLMTGVACTEIKARIDEEYYKLEAKYIGDAHNLNKQYDLHNFTVQMPKLDLENVEIVSTITFVVGLIQLLMGLLHVEFLAAYMSDQLVNGFCTGAAVHVVIVQFNKLFEIKVKKADGYGYIFKYIYDVFASIQKTNLVAAVLSLVGFVILYIGKDIINPLAEKRLPCPIPFELILVILSTAVSAFFNLHKTQNISIVENIPLGLPEFNLPRTDIIHLVLYDSLEIAAVVVALHISMCKVFNRKLGTRTDNNQELYALGFMGTLSSFFGTYPITTSLGRSMLNVECGVKTQMSAYFCGALLLVVILSVGPLLSALPMCILSVIIIYSVKNVFKKMPFELWHLWKVAKMDCVIWLVAFLSTAIFNVMTGLIFSIVFALLTTVFRIQWPRWQVLSRLNGTEEYRDCGRYARVTFIKSIRVFRFDAPLLFTNVDSFANAVEKALWTQRLKLRKPSSPAKRVVAKIFAKNGKQMQNKQLSEDVKHFIIDCSGFTFVDYTSVSSLIDVFHQLEKRDISVYFAGAKAPVRDKLEDCGFFKSVGRSNFYPTIHDAVNASVAAMKQQDPKCMVRSPSVFRSSIVVPMGGDPQANIAYVPESEASDSDEPIEIHYIEEEKDRDSNV
ncbi:unnamed protein product [Bursaphelenchus okinawaensis]|uniref:STAS domain-containing protein n=1 Tax=Bursaphelenchus okinawaensis TaxID=465554 RepID=A0A811LCW4_9BILA|nr:unnamed protein product [Bursaphelenchus okinawaensis]CAG9120434.1 unnamed protein product [Bursaphelenchus okinawaensis]